MRKRSILLPAAGLVMLLVFLLLVWFFSGVREDLDDYDTVERRPKIRPEYQDAVIPPNICPLNFIVAEPGIRYAVRISSTRGEPIEVQTRSASVVIPPTAWRALLGENAGEKLTFDVYVKNEDERWQRFAPIVNTIAEEKIDPVLVYRDMPAYNLKWQDMAIVQRDLEGYDRAVILRSRGIGNGCCNCHSFRGNRPEDMLLQVRGGPGANVTGGMLVARGGAVEKIVGTKTPLNAVPGRFLGWHPSGRIVAFSTDDIPLYYNEAGPNRYTVEKACDVFIYLIDSNTVTTTPEIARSDRIESSPAWSHDGRFLYFVSTAVGPIEEYRERRYDLVRVGYDIETNTWGTPEVVISTNPETPALARPRTPLRKGHYSVSQPKVSPDGRFLCFCIAEYGNFPPWVESSDLCMLDLEEMEYWYLDALNSGESEAWHCWSSNSRWIVYSSQKDTGLLVRPYFAHIDATGNATGPFVLPQKDPTFYDTYIRTYNRPEFTTGRVRITQRHLLRALSAPEKQVRAQADPKLAPAAEAGGRD